MMSRIEFGHPHTRIQYVASSNQVRHPTTQSTINVVFMICIFLCVCIFGSLLHCVEPLSLLLLQMQSCTSSA